MFLIFRSKTPLTMNFLKLFLLLSILLMALAIAESSAGSELDANFLESGDQMISSVRGGSRFLLSHKKPRVKMTCNKYPMVCRLKGSPGPYCCKKKCVNVLTDRLNCGKCGKKCNYNEICCKGKCVNPYSDKKHCGGCNNRCINKGSYCMFGMCSYAN